MIDEEFEVSEPVRKAYFGDLWDAPNTDPGSGIDWWPIATPVGERCPMCGEEIADGDRGEMIPHWGAAAVLIGFTANPGRLDPAHIECLIADTSGCYFGVCPTGRCGPKFEGTRREYAFAVLDRLNRIRMEQGNRPL